MGSYSSIQHNATQIKGASLCIPKPLVAVVQINGHPARTLVDLGSLSDFMSSTLVQQLNVKRKELALPLPVQLAVWGSQSHINYGTTATFQYQSILED